jgi:hypothetical protein
MTGWWSNFERRPDGRHAAGQTMNGIIAILLACAVSALVRPAMADSLEGTLAGFGLLGRWAVDCGAAPSTDNPYGLYRMLSPHEAELLYDFGPQFEPHVHIITFAEPVAGNRLRLKQLDRQDGSYLETVLQRLNGRIQNVSVVQSDGKVVVKDGIYTANGSPAVWLERCR